MNRSLAVALTSLLFSCQAVDRPMDQGSALTADDGSAEGSFEGNCFTEIQPGGVVLDGKFDGVYFYNGNCTGEVRALNKLSFQKEIVVVSGSDSQKSALYLKGDQVGVKLDGDFVSIGSLEGADDANNPFQIDAGVTFELVMKSADGDSKTWEFGDKAQAGQEEIRVYL